jgi:hypothetical protein
MSKVWSFMHAVECQASRDSVWEFWTKVANWAAVDPGLESAELDGPFATGTNGTTKPRGQDPVRWRLAEVHDRSSALIELSVPGAVLKFLWKFEDTAGGGTLIMQRVGLEGPRADAYTSTVGPEMEKGIPPGMQRLAAAIDRAAGGRR